MSAKNTVEPATDEEVVGFSEQEAVEIEKRAAEAMRMKTDNFVNVKIGDKETKIVFTPQMYYEMLDLDSKEKSARHMITTLKYAIKEVLMDNFPDEIFVEATMPLVVMWLIEEFNKVAIDGKEHQGITVINEFYTFYSPGMLILNGDTSKKKPSVKLVISMPNKPIDFYRIYRKTPLHQYEIYGLNEDRIFAVRRLRRGEKDETGVWDHDILQYRTKQQVDARLDLQEDCELRKFNREKAIRDRFLSVMFRNGFSIPTIASHTEYGDYYEEISLPIVNDGTEAIVLLPINTTDNPEDLQREIRLQDDYAKNRYEVEWPYADDDADETVDGNENIDEDDPLGACKGKDGEEDDQDSNSGLMTALVGYMLDDVNAEVTSCEDGVVITAPEEEEEAEEAMEA